MRNIELLAPAGSMDSVKSAVYNGANAIYLGIKQFNARNNIDGFNLDNLGMAVDFAHLYGVKVYLALNILFKDDELQDALDIVAEANNKGVDAFIIQDLGLAYLIHKHYPNIELHASTQMAVHNLEGVRILERLGFKRVVLARETSIDEIKRISDNSDIEIEFFVQGALCVSFSGNCYMCSHLVDKSGNRGLCQQFCRLPYTFEAGKTKKNGFLLSAKDISMLGHIQQLKDLGICSLKIEGRARRPFYVAQACKIYRNMLDLGKYSAKDLDLLKLAFNRGYTPAYFDGNGNIISQIQGNNGLLIGEVIKINNGKKFNEVYIRSSYELKGKCGLKFIYNGEEIASIGAYDIKHINGLYRLTTTSNIKVGSKVHIIQDETLEIETLKYTKKLPISIKFMAMPNQPINISAQYKDIEISLQGDICQSAKTISITSDQVLKQLSRSDIFEIKLFDAEIGEVYILNSIINKLRNTIYEDLKQSIIQKYTKTKVEKVNIKEDLPNSASTFDFRTIDSINNITKSNNLILDYQTFDIEQLKQFDKYCNQQGINGYIDVPNFATEKDIELIKYALKQTSLGVVANNLYALNFDCKIIGGQFLNAYNSITIKVLNSLHKLEALFIEELNQNQMSNLKSTIPLIKREKVYMTLLHCPFKHNLKCDCASCKYQDATYTINSGKKFKIKRKRTSGCVFLLKD